MSSWGLLRDCEIFGHLRITFVWSSSVQVRGGGDPCTVLYCTVLYCTVLYCVQVRGGGDPWPWFKYSLPTRHRTQEMRKWSELQFIWTQTNWDPQIISYSALPGPGRALLILLHCTCCLRKQCFRRYFTVFRMKIANKKQQAWGQKISIFKT